MIENQINMDDMLNPNNKRKRMIGEVLEISAKEAVDFLLPRHYSGRKPNVCKAFAWIVGGGIKAVITFGKPASDKVCSCVCGEKYKDRVYELNRLCRVDDFHEPLSNFVSACLRRMRIQRCIIISYSDTAMNHHGYIYQACNFIYTGCTNERTDIYAGENRHARHYTKDDATCGIRVVRSAKHRYIYFCTYLRNEKKEWMNALKLPVLPYPKGDNNEDYVLGTVLKQKLITV